MIDKSTKTMKSIFRWLVILFVGIIIAFFLRVFVFAIYTIPSPSMEPTIISGDRIVVNKLIFGSRLITNLFFLKGEEKSNYIRMPGLQKIERNDILVFNFPYWKNQDICNSLFYVKRCVAIPKDTFYIENGIYKVKGILDTLGYYPNQKHFHEISKDRIKENIYNCFPKNEYYSWNCKEFGPLYLPAKGDTIIITSSNLLLYKNMIAYETGKKVSESANNILLGDSVMTWYVFQENYYFMAGDYAFDSQDSRYWGPLPEDHIVGKVVFIYKSIDPLTGNNRWNRFLKFVN